MAHSIFFSLALCFLVSWHGSVAQQQQPSQRRFRQQSQCLIPSMSALEPNRRIEAEAGVTEYWDENHDQFDCAGVAATRHTIQPRGLLLPSFANAPRLIYIVQGRGITGAIFPGCPESFQSVQQSQQSEESRSQRFRDQHQKIRHFREGDIVALPAGVAHWCYNDGETPVVAVSVLDTSSFANQLDQNLRRFHIAGTEQYEQQQESESQRSRRPEQGRKQNIFSGFDVNTLAEAFGISRETARKLQNEDDQRGNIVNVENGLQVVRPPRREEDEEQQQRGLNGLEETVCSSRLMENIADPIRADVYNPQGGRISSLNSQKLPVLNFIQLSAERGVLYRAISYIWWAPPDERYGNSHILKNALMAPHWNLNAHSVVYATRGNGRIQIVGNHGRAVFDSELREGQMVVIPQAFAVVKQAGNEGFEWVAFKTNDNAMTSPIVGKASAIRAMPEDVLMNSFRISREEARRLKYNRGQETVVFAPSSRAQGGAAA